MLLHEFFGIMTDPAHMAAEFFWEIFFLVLGVLISRRGIRREHRVLDQEHGVQHVVFRSDLLDVDPDEPIPFLLTEHILHD